ncbi:MAG: carbohydrate binding family 9 domain-containing protein [Maribacter sp.]|nr:carbohydrate binding family 9 domain-containing protein [Maribacter sp.]
MTSLKTFVLLLITSVFGIAQDRFEPQKSKPGNIIIDGLFGDEEWTQAVQVDLDYEINPGNNLEPSRKTTGYITYTDTDLYVSFYAYANPENVRASIRPRDDRNFWSDDLVFIRLDTYADARNNYILAVSPLGSQYDVRAINAVSAEERYDGSFNVDFESAGTITSDGYSIEMRIPFANLPFPSGTDQLWHFNLFRQYFQNRTRIEVGSQSYDRDNSCEVCQTTDELVLKDIVIEKRRELLPYVAANLTGKRPEAKAAFEYDDFSPKVGLGINLDLNKNTALEVTFNPDFSQVEADITQIDINSSYALEYPERRPFFNRGADIVNFSDGAFYSRAINNPLVASKLLSQGKKARVYFLTAVDQDSPYLIAGEDRSYFGEGGQSFVNVFRYQKLVNKNIRLGMLTTNRFYKNGGYGNLMGTDGWLLLSKNWRFTYEFFANFNKEPVAEWIDSDDVVLDKTVRLDGEEFSGTAMRYQLYYNTEHWKSSLTYRSAAPHYQSNVGFVVKNNRRWTTLVQKYQNFINKKALQFFSVGYKTDLQYTSQKEFKTLSIDGILELRTLFNTYLNYTYDWDAFKLYLNREYKNLGIHQIMIRSSPSESFSVFMNIEVGKDIAYNEDIPDIGKQFNAYISPSFQLNNKFNVKPSIQFARLKKLNENAYYFNGSISRLTLRYQFDNSFSLRLVSEYNDFTERFFVQPLLQWNPNPSTVFYIGGNQNSIEDYNSEYRSPFRIDETQFFLKFQYLIGL